MNALHRILGDPFTALACRIGWHTPEWIAHRTSQTYTESQWQQVARCRHCGTRQGHGIP